MKPAIALFARAPLPGQVKTRLVGRWTPEQVADLYRAFVLDMWEMLGAFAPASELFLYADAGCAEWRALAGAQARLQQGAGLGQRMLHCFDELHAAGFGPLLIVGSDSPALSANLLAPWTALLAQSPALLGPAEDGGYYAIGCRQPHPRMFEGVEWSSPRTLSQTAAALQRCGLPPAYLPSHFDVDTPEDLARLRAEPYLGRHTRRWLEHSALRS
ncbi:MAG: TIGR04282 family arsenosugar biosynthesis glycosyltransferase [Acidobacteria bacterium]|nr:TIGR04282 family arsenosugar biosynthesis glycosyltransferase [Acidobacteriota bacterium]